MCHNLYIPSLILQTIHIDEILNNIRTKYKKAPCIVMDMGEYNRYYW